MFTNLKYFNPNMEVAFSITLLIILISGYFFYNKRKEIQKKSRSTLYLQTKFLNNIDMFPSIFQYILLSHGNEFLKRLYVIITLKKNFCLSQLFFSDLTEYVIIKGYLKSKKSVFFICNSSKNYFGLKYIKKIKENVYGRTTEKIIKFKENYNFLTFYCSYLPNEANEEFKNTSEVFLKCNLELLNNKNFIDDFFDLINDLQDEEDKQLLVYKKSFNYDKLKFEENEKKNFVEKLVEEMNKKSSKIVVKIPNKKKRNK